MKNITQSIKIITIALVLSVSIAYVSAWTAPTATPPGGNVSAPLNTSNASQYKDGALGIGGYLQVYSSILSNVERGDLTSGILGSIGLYGKKPGAAKPNQSGWTIYNMEEYGGRSGLSIWEYYDTNGNGTTCESGETCTDRFNIARGGNVGIGVSAPTAKLDILGDNTGVNGIQIKTISSAPNTAPVGIKLSNNLGDAAGAGGTHYVGVDYAGNFRIERPTAVGPNYMDFLIDPTGNVGIGVPAPTKKLDVAGDIKASGDICTTTKCLNSVGGGGKILSSSLSSIFCPSTTINIGGRSFSINSSCYITDSTDSAGRGQMVNGVFTFTTWFGTCSPCGIMATSLIVTPAGLLYVESIQSLDATYQGTPVTTKLFPWAS